MILRISSGQLYKMLQVGQNAISSKPPYPILADFLFSMDGDKLSITSTDLEFTIISETTITPSDTGQFAFPAEILVSTLKEMPEQPIELIFEEADNMLKMISAYGNYRSSSNSIEDYPEIPEIRTESQINIPASRFLKAISTCVFATATDEMKANMLGIAINIQPDAVIVAATDAHKLVKYTIFHDNGENESELVIPKKAVSVLRHIIEDDENLQINYDRNHIFFE